ncbi:putative gtpase-activating protein [Diplodia seriata]|uniref:Putative gtpase-activating protein n=1 Tax=Diplodia seriata TaxID=420778 RepID=A0A0G2EM00_9PEZI|nr:putative gtpase-activating protein [Diplodia seriata]
MNETHDFAGAARHLEKVPRRDDYHERVFAPLKLEDVIRFAQFAGPQVRWSIENSPTWGRYFRMTNRVELQELLSLTDDIVGLCYRPGTFKLTNTGGELCFVSVLFLSLFFAPSEHLEADTLETTPPSLAKPLLAPFGVLSKPDVVDKGAEERTFMHAASKILSGEVDAALKMFWLTERGKNQPDAHLALFLTILRAVKTADIQINDIQDHRMSFLELALNTVAKTYATTPAGEKPGRRGEKPRYLMGMLERLTIPKHQALGPYKFTHQQLEKEGVIQKSDVPEKQRDTIYINLVPKRLTTSFTMYETHDFADAARYLLDADTVISLVDEKAWRLLRLLQNLLDGAGPEEGVALALVLH